MAKSEKTPGSKQHERLKPLEEIKRQIEVNDIFTRANNKLLININLQIERIIGKEK